MKKSFLVTTLIMTMILILSFNQKQTIDKSFARVGKINNKFAFFWNEPINDYEVAFTFENIIPNYNCSSPRQILDHSLNNANKEAANQNKLFDGIIIAPSTKRDLAIVFKDKTQDNAIARVNRNEGKFLFIECEPLTDYDVVGKYNVSGVGRAALTGNCPTLQRKIDNLIKKGTKAKLEFDAVIFGSSKNDLVIKLK